MPVTKKTGFALAALVLDQAKRAIKKIPAEHKAALVGEIREFLNAFESEGSASL